MLFSQAVAVHFDRILDDETRVYMGTVDPFWTIGSVPHGGYLLGCILEAVIHSQSTTGQPDPIHLSSHFLAASRPGAYEIRISRVRTGRQFSNLIAHFFQNNQINITSHVIVGTLAPAVMTNDRSCLTIIPPHPFAIRTPFRQHPSMSDPDQLPSILAFRSQLRASFDRIVEERSHAKANAPQEGNGCFDYGAWYEILGEDKGSRLSMPAVAFLADLGRNAPGILPKCDRPISPWYPTLTLAIEFKVKLSSLPACTAPRTFGVFSTGRFIHQGRHDAQAEIWTAPCAIGEKRKRELGSGTEEWRDKMLCVAIARQMALTSTVGVNKRLAREQAPCQTRGNRAAHL
ncbi:hypothetical protein BS47DRAFT_1341917 [Hydnum rufescens UP504]|uniref:Uncharacterized protein n=1 Tax=Hydnum rufescens UP504 TaxID=1448309 RepID=A0A9P6B0Q0_9AGAM|nr:hypothetical protein BS47DRAFT_1341917 [Hydnum rufescens UP504]